jgi:hypothetical protein
MYIHYIYICIYIPKRVGVGAGDGEFVSAKREDPRALERP